MSHLDCSKRCVSCSSRLVGLPSFSRMRVRGRSVLPRIDRRFSDAGRQPSATSASFSEFQRLGRAYSRGRNRQSSARKGGRAVDRSQREESGLGALPKALIGSPEPPLHPPCSAEGCWRRKTTNETRNFARAFLSQTASAPLEVETNGSAQRISYS
jgi:hypothetical protein